MTDSTKIMANTPSVSPIMETSEKNEINDLRRFARVYRNPMKRDKGLNISPYTVSGEEWPSGRNQAAIFQAQRTIHLSGQRLVVGYYKKGRTQGR